MNNNPTNVSLTKLPALLNTSNLTITVGSRKLITNLNWQVNPGECWCVIGRNGAGKTTLLRGLAGLTSTDSGKILMNNKSLNSYSLTELARIRSYLPQNQHDVFAYRVLETVLGARHPYNDGHYWESPDDLALAHAALSELDVADLANRDVRNLSGGERQRVAIAALLAQDAQLMMLDEPTSSLDLAHQISVIHLFSQRCKTKNKAILMVSHDLNLAQKIATHALLLMGDGHWQAGLVSETMTAAALSDCLGHPIEIIWHNNQRVFLPF
jgi:iron complex transport system ATP-binding protein